MISTQSTPPIDIAANHALAMPAHVDHSHLVVEDLATVSQWYQRIMGLKPLETSASGETLGVGARPLLTLTTAAMSPGRHETHLVSFIPLSSFRTVRN